MIFADFINNKFEICVRIYIKVFYDNITKLSTIVDNVVDNFRNKFWKDVLNAIR